jgi:hypothetical protein
VYLVREGKRIRPSCRSTVAVCGRPYTVSWRSRRRQHHHRADVLARETPDLGDFIEPRLGPVSRQAGIRQARYAAPGSHQGGVDPPRPGRLPGRRRRGATLTSRGVNNLLRYWLGDQGFGPYLRRLQADGGKT